MVTKKLYAGVVKTIRSLKGLQCRVGIGDYGKVTGLYIFIPTNSVRDAKEMADTMVRELEIEGVETWHE